MVSRKSVHIVLASAACVLLAAPGNARDSDKSAAIVAATEQAPVDAGVASYYADRFAGNRTANGERYDPNALTAAHRTLPMGSLVRVVDAQSGRSVVVRINDRGPHGAGRVIDLSRAAAEELGLVRRGIGRVELHRAEGSAQS